jgi:glycosyltransferase involved in cell wall biosynthesis
VDFFVVPSKFIRSRYVEWGLPEEKTVLLPYGTELHMLQKSEGVERDDAPNVFGFFGQINDYKGVDVIVDAVSVMTEEEREGISVEIFGNLSLLREGRKEKLEEGFKEFRDTIRFNGPYQAQELSRLMRRVHWVVVPSIWWENAPLVIDEAFALGKPVICSNIGGMAEKVRDGVDGLHFDVGNHRALARLMVQHSGDRVKYDSLRKNVAQPIAIEEIARKHVELYRQSERIAV